MKKMTQKISLLLLSLLAFAPINEFSGDYNLRKVVMSDE